MSVLVAYCQRVQKVSEGLWRGDGGPQFCQEVIAGQGHGSHEHSHLAQRGPLVEDRIINMSYLILRSSQKAVTHSTVAPIWYNFNLNPICSTCNVIELHFENVSQF